MNKKYILIFSILITGLIASEINLFSFKEKEFEKVTILRVIDGDTVVLNDGRVIRLLNINSPEKDMPNYEQSKKYLEKFVNQSLSLESKGLDKYQRTLGKLYSPQYLNLELVEKGLASKFLVDEKELKEFYDAEAKSIKRGEGIWIHSPYFGCISASINPKKEIVKLLLTCNVSTNNWYLKDESRKVYKFKEIDFKEVNLISDNGVSNQTNLYWGVGNVWNDGRDSIYIFDEEGKIVFSYSYGY